MKTPKRTKVELYECPECGSFAVLYDIEEKKEYLKCNTCGRVRHKSFFRIPAFENAIFARWKRKNREAMLRHALRRKENANRLLAEKLVRARMLELAYESFIDKMLESYFEIGTYGQDIEGS